MSSQYNTAGDKMGFENCNLTAATQVLEALRVAAEDSSASATALLGKIGLKHNAELPTGVHNALTVPADAQGAGYGFQS